MKSIYRDRKSAERPEGCPALVIELKWNQSAGGAIAQIRDRRYCDSLKDYRGNLLLVGINYDKKTREHTCRIVNDRKEM